MSTQKQINCKHRLCSIRHWQVCGWFPRTAIVRSLLLLSSLLLWYCFSPTYAYAQNTNATLPNPQPSLTSQPIADPPTQTNITQQIVDAINQLRATAGMGALTLNPLLSSAAQAYANELAILSRFSHQGADGSNPMQRVQRAGYAGSYVGENLAGAFDPAMAMTLWNNSPGHQRNILDPEFVEIGVGYHYDAVNQWMVYVTEFGRSRDQAESAPQSTTADLVGQTVAPVRRVYAIAKGDTIVSIAARFHVNWKQLLTLNGLTTETVLQIGQQIYLE